jgi:cytochrome c oxidase subunit II
MQQTDDLPFFPEAASRVAREVDALFFSWSAVSLFFSALIAFLIVYFMVKYRRRSPDEVGAEEKTAIWLEIAWSAIPLIITLVMFAWGAKVFFDIYRAPANAVEYTAVGKQWMWKIQHPSGNREINAFHVPAGQPIRLTLTSEDVIHSFFVPALRIKQDAVPGRYTSLWFNAEKPGVYHLFCTEYCGAEHSKMIGSVTVLEPKDYENWLAGAPTGGQSMVASGAQLFQTLACNTCHEDAPGRPARGPNLEGLYQNQVALVGGRQVIADDNYLRESILNPAAQVVAGWSPLMPTYQGQVTEEQLSQLIAYVRSLSGGGGEGTGGSPAPAPGAAAAGAASDSNVPPSAGPARQQP